MGRSKISALIGGALFFLPAANALAADIPNIPAPPQIGGGWYLRGDIGMANQGFSGLSHPGFDDPAFAPDSFRWLDKGNFDAVPTFQIGLGYQYSDHVRFDVTGEYRGNSAFSALDEYDTNTVDSNFGSNCNFSPSGDCATNHYTGKKSELLFLANAYYDFSSWHNVTPYFGAGIGVSYNTISGFVDDNVITGGQGWAPTGHEMSLAWALHAGASVQVTPSMSVDFGYSFVSLGDAQTGLFQNVDPALACTGTGGTCYPMKFKGLYSNDFKIGVRWALGQPAQQSYYPPVVKY